MENIFSDRISDVPRSFIREILKVTLDKEIISFAGGLPNRDLFPVEELKNSTIKVYDEAGREVLQYTNSEGYLELRRIIADRYKRKGLNVSEENILITTGSQQGLDVLGKTFLNERDNVIIEEPGYLGAIQAFSVHRASFRPVTMDNEGMKVEDLKQQLAENKIKLMYTVPNFQNPTGITYARHRRELIAELIQNQTLFLIEDDPYGDLRFFGDHQPSFKSIIPERTILLGSFSKTVVPSFRIGWIVAPENILDKLIIAKQASDLHTNYLCQRIIARYIDDYDFDAHIQHICRQYGSQRDAMINAIRKNFPDGVDFTQPEGGMFLWITLPEGLSSMDLFESAIRNKVAFVPGNPFYTYDVKTTNNLRLNFSCVDENMIETGILRLAEAINEILIEKEM
jgi:2-aminoadipate transaminase